MPYRRYCACLFFNIFFHLNGTLRAFRLLAEPHAVTRVCFIPITQKHHFSILSYA